MATAPVKPQQLHNFPLSLKWGQTTTLTAANNRSSSRSTTTLLPDSETESEPEPTARPTRVGSRSVRVHRLSFPNSCSTTTLLSKPNTRASPEKQQKQAAVLEKPQQQQEEEQDGGEGEEEEEKGKGQDEGEGNSRPWKLRPRKGIFLGGRNGGGGEVKDVSEPRERENTQQPKSMRLRGLVKEIESGGGGGEGCFEKKEKRKFWIALSREEIEEDVFVMTGSRPARRPRKRPKNVQKVLDVKRSFLRFLSLFSCTVCLFVLGYWVVFLLLLMFFFFKK